MAFNWADDVDDAVEKEELPNFAKTCEAKPIKDYSQNDMSRISNVDRQKISTERNPVWKAKWPWRGQTKAPTPPLLASESMPKEDQALVPSLGKSKRPNGTSTILERSPDDGTTEDSRRDLKDVNECSRHMRKSGRCRGVRPDEVAAPKGSASDEFKVASIVASSFKQDAASDLTPAVSAGRDSMAAKSELEDVQTVDSEDGLLYRTASKSSIGGKSDVAQSEYYTPPESPLSTQSEVIESTQQNSAQSISMELLNKKDENAERERVDEGSSGAIKEANDKLPNVATCEGPSSENQSLEELIRKKLLENERWAPEWAKPCPAETLPQKQATGCHDLPPRDFSAISNGTYYSSTIHGNFASWAREQLSHSKAGQSSPEGDGRKIGYRLSPKAPEFIPSSGSPSMKLLPSRASSEKVAAVSGRSGWKRSF